MITHLKIKNFAIIDEIDVDFDKGLSVMTGETGAGKSIIIQAVNMALGSRANTSFVSTGKDKAVIQMTVDELPKNAEELLNEAGVESDDGELILSREINSSGKSVCRLNGDIVSLSVMNKVGHCLADIHGQYEHQSLLDPANHLSFIDSYSADKTQPILQHVADVYSRYDKADKALKHLASVRSESLRQQDFMKYELNEIETASVNPGEDDELKNRLNILQNSEKIFAALSRSYDILFNSDLDTAMNSLDTISDISDDYSSFKDIVSDCYYRISDLCEEMRHARDSISFSPEETDTVIERLDFLELLKKKYGGSIDAILEYKKDLLNKLGTIEDSEETAAQLEEEKNRLMTELSELCSSLTQVRKEVAAEIEEKVMVELSELNFKNALFKVNFGIRAREDGTTIFSSDGIDTAEFYFTANVGESLKPLTDVASGGEASRIMLAFKRIIGDYVTTPTMIFDEIDTGISGITASIVSKKLRQISEAHQVICITHLPQIAAAGDTHYCIEKEIKGDKTYSNVYVLDNKDRIMEIARLIGGTDITDKTVASAEELLSLNTSSINK